jgi:predicted O-linked N-acetylglucosamine transferase (SPINDLY family)
LRSNSSIEQADAACREGQSCAADNRLDDAEVCFRKALSLSAGHEQSRAGLQSIAPDLDAKLAAVALHQRGALHEAAAAYGELLNRRPGYPEVLNNLGVLRLQLGDAAGAAQLLQQAVARKPALAGAQSNFGAALRRLRRYDEALAAYRSALDREPHSADVHYNLGHTLVELRRLGAAIKSYQRALDCDPEHAGARSALAHQRRHLCDWSEFDADQAAQRALATAGSEKVTPFDALVAFDDPELQLACARRQSVAVATGATVLPMSPPVRRNRIRLGYLSSDFRAHPIAWLCAELFERHDRSRFEVFGYSHGADDGSTERDRLTRAFDHFVDLGTLDDASAATRIRADQIDILIDLNGHTLGARTGILARRPAPVQAHWLGFPGPMGADYVDYVIGDAFVTPPESQQWFSECIVRLPHCFQPGDSTLQPVGRSPSRSECGLPEQGFVFCCFNNAYKLTPPVFAVWMRLLKAVPGSVLWLLEMFPEGRANLERTAQEQGIETSRLVFAPRVPLPEYLARYRCADLFLDTLPYNAGATARDALRMGLPLLTCAGRSFAARMAGSLLHVAGVPELITQSLAEYEALALRLAHAPHTLAKLLGRQSGAASGVLFDTGRFTRGLEAAYVQMHDCRLAGLPPQPIDVADPYR